MGATSLCCQWLATTVLLSTVQVFLERRRSPRVPRHGTGITGVTAQPSGPPCTGSNSHTAVTVQLERLGRRMGIGTSARGRPGCLASPSVSGSSDGKSLWGPTNTEKDAQGRATLQDMTSNFTTNRERDSLHAQRSEGHATPTPNRQDSHQAHETWAGPSSTQTPQPHAQTAAAGESDIMTDSPMDRMLMMRGHWGTERTLHRAMPWIRTLGR